MDTKKVEKFINCKHEKTTIKKRQLQNGSFQYRYQCDYCHSSIGIAINKQKAIYINGGHEPDLFNEYLCDKTKKLIAEYYKLKYEEEKKIKQEAFWSSYNEYLSTEEWNNKRKKVLERDKYLCQGCLENKATQVHHLTYQNVGEELLFQLISLCKECHSKLHDD